MQQEGFEVSPKGHIFKSYDGKKGNFIYFSFNHDKKKTLRSIRAVRDSWGEYSYCLSDFVKAVRQTYPEYFDDIMKDFKPVFSS